MKPMGTFDPSKPGLLHDRLEDRTFEWSPDQEADFRRHARPHAPGVVAYNGLLLDGWDPIEFPPTHRSS